MKFTRAIVFLLLATAFVLPCAAQTKRAKSHTGLHPVANADGKWGFIDSTGRFRIPPRYNGAREFSEGVAYAWFWRGEQRVDGIVDANGKFTELPATNDYQFILHDGLARFQTPSGQERKYGYMDKTGRVVIPPQFHDAGHFSEGLAWVAVLKERWLYGFIDKTGKMVIEPQFVYQPRDFVEGLAKVMGQQHSGFIDRTGSFRIKVDYEKADDFFSEGLLASVIEGEQPRGVYLRSDGTVALEIPLWQNRTARQRSLYSIRHQQLAPFSEGLAPVLSFNKIGFIDKTGKVVIEPLFRGTNGFSEGLAAVKIISSDVYYVWGYIDRTGKLVITPQFGEARPFAGGLAQVSTPGGKRQLIDKSGKVIWQL